MARWDPGVAVAAVPALAIDPQDLALRHRQVLRHVTHVALAAVTRGDVEQPIILVAAAGGRVELDLLDPVDLPGETEAQRFPTLALKDRGGRVVSRPLVHA